VVVTRPTIQVVGDIRNAVLPIRGVNRMERVVALASLARRNIRASRRFAISEAAESVREVQIGMVFPVLYFACLPKRKAANAKLTSTKPSILIRRLRA
jgi:hypothetical protein